jgi:glycosyltransferase involved in cell wall biosynthesis
MRFESVKRGSFERFIIEISEKAGSQYKFVFVFASDPPDWLRNELARRGARVDSAYFRTSWQAICDLHRLMRAYRPEIVHMHFFSLLSPFIPYLRWRYRLKMVVHIHAIMCYEAGKTRFATWLIPLRKRVAANSISLAIAVSDFVRKKTAAQFPFRKDQIVTIYNGVETTICPQTEAPDIRSSLGLRKDSTIILSAAWLNELKGVHVLIQSLPLVLKCVHGDIALIIAGDGPQGQALRRLAESLGIEQNVYFLGWRDDVPQLLEQADIVVIPSICEEACSYFALESMAAGKPIVGSAIGSIPELLSGDPPAGLLFAPGDAEALSEALESLLTNSKERQILSSEAQQRGLHRFHISKQIQLTTAIYSRLLS